MLDISAMLRVSGAHLDKDMLERAIVELCSHEPRSSLADHPAGHMLF